MKRRKNNFKWNIIILILSYNLIKVDYCNCDYSKKIVGGYQTSIKKYPYLVSIISTVRQNRMTDCMCAGTILTDRWILTAAHCLYKGIGKPMYQKYKLSAVAGSTKCYNIESDAQIRRIEYYHPHPKYKSSLTVQGLNTSNDIALVRLEEKLKFGRNVRKVQLLTPAMFSEIIEKPCEAIGWGAQSEDDSIDNPVLQKVKLPLIDTHRCVRLLENRKIHVAEEYVLCTLDPENKRDVCTGDSGGPLMCSQYQAGIVSGGSGCARPNTPNLWTRVDVYYTWIKSVTKEKNEHRQFRNSGYNIIYIPIFILFLLCIHF